MIFQRTIKEAVSATGIGLHSGSKFEVTFRPAPANTGIIYTSTALSPKVSIEGTPEAVRDTNLCTALVNLAGVRMPTV